jgi:hypothetical protein
MTATSIEMRPPARTLLNRSRPTSSVPNPVVDGGALEHSEQVDPVWVLRCDERAERREQQDQRDDRSIR